MIQTLIKAIVLALVCFAVYYVATLILTALSLPPIIGLVILVLLVLAFCVWILREFGISL